MSEKEKSVKSFANPAPLGLAGFGLALTMISFFYSTIIGLSVPVYATVLTLGFIAPMLAGIFEFIKGNTFRAITLTMLSLFFLSLYIIWINPFGATAAADANSMGIFYIIWTLVSLFLLTASIMQSQMKHWMQSGYLLCFALFSLVLSIAQFTGSNTAFIIGGVIGFLTSIMIFVDFVFHLIFVRPRTTSPS